MTSIESAYDKASSDSLFTSFYEERKKSNSTETEDRPIFNPSKARSFIKCCQNL